MPHSVLSREIELVQLDGMPEVLYPSKAHCLRLDKGNAPCFGVLGHMAFVPIPGWKGRKEVAEQDGLEGTVILRPVKRPWRCRYVFDVLPVDKEAVIAVVRVVLVDETREEPDVGIP